MSVPSVFEADLPTVDYENASSPDEAHRNLRKALERGADRDGGARPGDPAATNWCAPRCATPGSRCRAGSASRRRASRPGPLWHRATTSLLAINGDDHSRLRRLVSKAFTPRSVTRLDGIIVDVITGLIEPALRGGALRGRSPTSPGPIPCRSSPRCSVHLARTGGCSPTGPTTSSSCSAGTSPSTRTTSSRRGGNSTTTSTTWSPADATSLTDDLISELIRAEDDGDRLTIERAADARGGHPDGGHRHHPQPGGRGGRRLLRPPRAVGTAGASVRSWR